MSSEFFQLKPVNYTHKLSVINKLLYRLYDRGPSFAEDLIDAVWDEDFEHKKPEWLVGEYYYSVAEALNLVKKDEKKISLTQLGNAYVESDNERPKNISQVQANIILKHFKDNPFSKICQGIYLMVASIFDFSKNIYPISLQIYEKNLMEYYTIKAGKILEWNEETRVTQFKNYLTNTLELKLIDIEDNLIRITELGFNFVVQIRLHELTQINKNL